MSGARGTTPPGAATEQEAARWVRGMFGRVAPRYDFLNHLLSFHVDRYWRARTVRRLRKGLERPDACVLDLCCGTGDLLIALARAAGRPVLGADFCHPMLVEARRKAARSASPCLFIEADALALPLPDACVDVITAAFGFRNLANYQQGLRETHRVLKPGGRVAILEFSQPVQPVLAGLYGFYSTRILPAIGRLISGDASAYRYLPDSVRKFPNADELAATMRACGFWSVEYERITGGIVTLHTGERGN